MWVLLLLACAPEGRPSVGPSSGGDPSLADPGGWLAAHPLVVDDDDCREPLCMRTAAAWRPDGTLLVALGVEGEATPEDRGGHVRPPADVLLVLDASCSVESALDVRGAAAEIALDHLRPDDTVGLIGFREAPAVLLGATYRTPGRALALEALEALDTLPTIDALLSELEVDPCEAAPLEQVVGEVYACTGAEPPLPDLDEEALADLLDLAALVEEWLDSPNAELIPGLQTLLCRGGTDVPAALDLAFSEAPSGTSARASRVVLVSDLDGGTPAASAADLAAARFVGLSVLGITPAHDAVSGAALGRAPGAQFLGAEDPAVALARWDEQFDLLIAPRAWSMVVEVDPTVDDHWALDHVWGATDRDGLGWNAAFASEDHGVLGVVLRSVGDDRITPWLNVTFTGPGWTETLRIAARLPLRALSLPVGTGEDLTALRLGARIDLHAARYARRPELQERVCASAEVLDDPWVDTVCGVVRLPEP